MMGCRSCFRDAGPILISDATPAFGNCEFCSSTHVDVWDVRIWRAAFVGLIEMYERVDSAIADGQRLEARIQADWDLFSFEDLTSVRAFLESVFSDDNHPLIAEGLLVRPRYSDSGLGADHETRWESFKDQLISKNRFFPAVSPDLDFLGTLLSENSRQLTAGLELYRGRVCPGPSPIDLADMGKPPAEYATAGRGNPLGIAHLYLASDVATCVKESRAGLHGYLSVATFRLEEEHSCVDLTRLVPENPFSLEEAALVNSMTTYRVLRELGRELALPVRPGANPIEYVPTQYLCEFAKSRGFAGIRYSSSLHPSGWNVVLFEDASVTAAAPVRVFEITSMSLEFLDVTQ